MVWHLYNVLKLEISGRGVIFICIVIWKNEIEKNGRTIYTVCVPDGTGSPLFFFIFWCKHAENQWFILFHFVQKWNKRQKYLFCVCFWFLSFVVIITNLCFLCVFVAVSRTTRACVCVRMCAGTFAANKYHARAHIRIWLVNHWFSTIYIYS